MMRIPAPLLPFLLAAALAAQSPPLFLAAPKGELGRDSDPTVRLLAADFDGDGDPDLVTGNASTSRRSLFWRNDGRGVLRAEGSSLALPPHYTTAMAAADFDGDGDLDLVSFGMGRQYLFLNRGAGTFVDATRGRLPSVTIDPSAAACGDIDGDGDTDLVLATHYSNQVYLNNGRAAFGRSYGRLPQVHCRTHALALGDVDGDGDLDLVTGNAKLGAPQQNRLYLNDGKGYFKMSAGGLPPISDETHALVLADLDGDGDLDLVAGNGGYPGGGADMVLLGDGRGRFTRLGGALPPNSDRTRSLAVGDVDGDGYPDLVAGGEVSKSPNRIWLGDGKGRFSGLPAPGWGAAAHDTRDLALADMDGDGDLDLVTANTSGHPNRLFLNLTRQAYAPAEAKLGAPYRLDYHARDPRGRRLQVVLPLFSPERGSTPIPPFGTLGLSTRAVIPVFPLFLFPSLPRGSVRFTIPGDPALVDRSFHTQALVVPSLLLPLEGARLTNVDGGRVVR